MLNQVEYFGEVRKDYSINIITFVRTLVKMMRKANKIMTGGNALKIPKLVNFNVIFDDLNNTFSGDIGLICTRCL